MEQSIEVISALTVAVGVISAAIGFWCMQPWRRAASADDKIPDNKAEEAGNLPGLTVIVYTEADEDEIAHCIDTLLSQEYPRLQVVVVTRATASHTEMLAGRFAGLDNVYLTFIPPGSHNLSERKLAITLGLKAAKGDAVLTTTSNIRPQSPFWLRNMMANFSNPDVELVLGFSRMDFNELKGPFRWYRQFDSALSAAQWIGYAEDGKPYRGDGYNLAFRRNTFFAHKGYAHTIFLHYGDDDLFVNELATAQNTRVVLDDAIVTTFWDRMANRIWLTRKCRYMFTSRWLPRAPFAKAGALSLVNWLALLAVVAASLTGLNLIWPPVAAFAAWCALQAGQIAAYRKLARRLLAVRLWWAIPPFMLAKPLVNALFRIKYKALKKSMFTWQH